MKPTAHYLVVTGILAIHLFLAYSITGLLPGYAGSFYWFTIPHLAILPLTVGALWLDFARPRSSGIVAVVALLLCSLGTYWFAISRWPGGDDGPGIAWAIVIGSASLANAVIGVPLAIYAHAKRLSSLVPERAS